MHLNMGANSHCHFAIFDLYEMFNWMYFAKKVNFCLDCADVCALDAGSMLKVSSQNTYYPGKQQFAVLSNTASTILLLMDHEVLNNRFKTVILTFYCCWDSIVQKCHISHLKNPNHTKENKEHNPKTVSH